MKEEYSLGDNLDNEIDNSDGMDRDTDTDTDTDANTLGYDIGYAGEKSNQIKESENISNNIKKLNSSGVIDYHEKEIDTNIKVNCLVTPDENGDNMLLIGWESFGKFYESKRLMFSKIGKEKDPNGNEISVTLMKPIFINCEGKQVIGDEITLKELQNKSQRITLKTVSFDRKDVKWDLKDLNPNSREYITKVAQTKDEGFEVEAVIDNKGTVLGYTTGNKQKVRNNVIFTEKTIVVPWTLKNGKTTKVRLQDDTINGVHAVNL